MDNISDFTFIAKIFFPALAGLVAGMIWYSQMLDGKHREGGIKRKSFTILGIFCMKLWMAYGLTILLDGQAEGATSGALGAFACGLLFLVPATFVQSLYHKKSLKLCLIEIVYHLLSFSVMGAVMYGLIMKW